MKDGLPDGSLFPEQYLGPVATPVESVDPPPLGGIGLDGPLIGSGGTLVSLFLLMIYTRFVQGKPVNPLKWVGWKPKSKR